MRQVRAEEIRAIAETASCRAVNEGVFYACVPLVGLLCFGPFVLLGGVLNARRVFVVLTLLIAVQLNL